MLLANENTYRKLSTFQSVEEMNEAIKAHRSAHKLSETERAVLDVISRYSCKYPGVCYLSKTNIGKAVGKVRRTVIRVCNRLEALGIIEQYETKRDGGDRRQSTNVIVILPLTNCQEQTTTRVATSKRATCHGSVVKLVDEQNGNPGVPDKMSESKRSTYSEVAPEMSRQEAPSKKLNNINYINTYYKPFYARFKAFIGSTIGKDSQRLVSRLYGVYLSHSTPLLRANAFDKHSVEAIGYRALHAAIMATKSKKIENLAGYYNGVLDRMLDRLYFESMAELYG
ncbi:hypothetical protein [Siminovitchia sp. 179-K 8D1 HS]|uniref:hypothetical protein n=1 Tax=Siminovitchia sp. 179-K 8D1 HS TaxID=3142385 RepID=UPI0039A2DA2D